MMKRKLVPYFAQGVGWDRGEGAHESHKKCVKSRRSTARLWPAPPELLTSTSIPTLAMHSCACVYLSIKRRQGRLIYYSHNSGADGGQHKAALKSKSVTPQPHTSQ